MRRQATASMAGSRRSGLLRNKVFRGFLGALLVLALSAAPAGAASTLPQEFLTQIGDESSAEAGRFFVPVGIATDPATGHVYVADRFNVRIDEFTPWGEFVKAFGWGVADGSSNELQVCTTTCFEGFEGSGAGQFKSAQGVAVDSSGAIYVFDRQNLRVQKFDSAGQFLLMFGGEVNKTTNGNVCTRAQLEGGDVCGAGTSGTGNGQFGIENVVSVEKSYIAVGPGDTVYAGDKDRIQEFAPSGAYKGEISLPESGNPGALAVDLESGDVYFSFNLREGAGGKVAQPGVYRHTDSGWEVFAEVKAPVAIATAATGEVFVVEDPLSFFSLEAEPRILEFAANGEPIIGPEEHFATPEPSDKPRGLRGLATNAVGDLYVSSSDNDTSFVSVYGPPPLALGPPPKVAPTIADQYAVTVDTDGAVVRAAIDPHFWADTTYYVEYGTTDCKVGPCAQRPVAPGSQLGAGAVSTPVATAGVFLGDLQPGTTYHYRFVAASGGGGPVFGEEGEGGTFTTHPLQIASSCPSNQAFRTGSGSLLPDCRAYEMVTPVDKNGGDAKPLGQVSGYPAGIDQSAASGGKLTYSTYRAFDEVLSGPYTSQYIASRDSALGWSNEPISPPRTGPGASTGGYDSDYQLFSGDLCEAWLAASVGEPALDPLSPPGLKNLYQRHNCGGQSLYTSLVQEEPLPDYQFPPELQGVSGDGRCVVFGAKARLAGSAPSPSSKKDIRQVYESCGGELRLISVLPNGTPSTVSSSAGSPGQEQNGRSASLLRAISEDGSRVFWSTPQALYVRLVDREETIPLVDASAGNPIFWAASADGSKALFGGNKLIEFDVDSEEARLIGNAVGVLGASEDLSRIYFVANRNLYLEEDGAVRFIAVLSGADVSSNFSPIALNPVSRLARVTPDGRHAVFTSSASLTGYDNTDASSGKPDLEVYLYSAEEDELRCLSCNPTGARPSGRKLIRAGSGEPWTAAWIPPWQNQLYASRVLADDGSRVFFNSFDALVPGDTNGKQDVYQWEAQGIGSCEEQDGCLDLISGGESPHDSEFVDSSADGGDVFFRTSASLVPQDPDLVDIYDARVGGGFPPPAPPPPGCEGEACQLPAAPPGMPAPASSSFVGPGNAKAAPRKKKAARHKKRQRRKSSAKGQRSEKRQHRHGRAAR